MARVGRPNKGTVKKPSRTLNSDHEIEDYLLHNPQVNASEVFRTAMRALMPKDQEEIRLKEIEDHIMETESHLGIMKMEREKIKKNLERRKRLRIDQRIETEMGAYYLRSLYLQGAFVPNKSKYPLADYINREIERGHYKKEYFAIDSPDKIKLLTDDRKVRIELSWYFKVEDNYVLPFPSKLISEEKEYRDRYFLAFEDNKFEKFVSEIIHDNIPKGELPIDYFLQFKPYVISERLKNDLRKRMEAEYLTMDIEVTQ